MRVDAESDRWRAVAQPAAAPSAEIPAADGWKGAPPAERVVMAGLLCEVDRGPAGDHGPIEFLDSVEGAEDDFGLWISDCGFGN